MFHLLTYLGKDPNFLLCFPRLFFLVREEQRLSQFYLVSLRIKHTVTYIRIQDRLLTTVLPLLRQKYKS